MHDVIWHKCFNSVHFRCNLLVAPQLGMSDIYLKCRLIISIMNLPSPSCSTSQLRGLLVPGLSCKAFTEGKSNSLYKGATAPHKDRQTLLGGEALSLEPLPCCQQNFLSPTPKKNILEQGEEKQMQKMSQYHSVQAMRGDLYCETPCKAGVPLQCF